ncbi:GNAT family N-acetyltransferase [Streptomyces sp. NPDC048331]|uniref:GNAT family N-acetyltransferase n=1 Tax=Streptomyces sp. NPDC048331 TaxID=3365534 RepID=UPI00371A89E5
MDLLPFTDAHAVTVAGRPSAQEAPLWCGRREFPVPARTITDRQRDEDARAHVLVEDEEPVGHGEPWFDAEEDEIELARIIVAPAVRGRGLGRVLVRRLLAQALGAGLHDVFLRVHPDNGTALRRYRSARFVPVDTDLAESGNEAQPVDHVRLRHDTEASGTRADAPPHMRTRCESQQQVPGPLHET